MKRRKLANALARKVLAGKITVDDAWHVLGMDITQKSAVPSLAKAESARPGLLGAAGTVPAAVPRYPGDEEYIRSAFRPVTRPAVTKAASPAPHESPAQILKAMRELGAMRAEPVRPPRAWTPAEAATLREAETMTDPQARERIRSGMIARRNGSVT